MRPPANTVLKKTSPTAGSVIIAKNQNTFAKRQREMEKKRKAEEKIKRRNERRAEESTLPPDASDALVELEPAPASEGDLDAA